MKSFEVNLKSEKSDSIIEWSAYCNDLYLVYEKDSIQTFFEILPILNFNGITSLNIESPNSLCCYIQLFSKCLKSERNNSHPERFLDSNCCHKHFNNYFSDIGTDIAGCQLVIGDSKINSLAILLWKILPNMKNDLFKFKHEFIHYYFLCMLLDLLKFEKSKVSAMSENFNLQQYNYIEFSLSIMKETITLSSSLLSNLKALDTVRCICIILSNTIEIDSNNSTFNRESIIDSVSYDLNDGTQKVLHIFNSLSELFLSLFPLITSSFSKSTLSSSPSTTCGFIEDSSPQVFAACGLTICITLINTVLKYVLHVAPNTYIYNNIPNNDNIDVSFHSLHFPIPDNTNDNFNCQTYNILSSIKIASLMKHLLILFAKYKTANIIKILGENDKDLILSLLQLEEIHIRLKTLFNNSNSNSNSNSNNSSSNSNNYKNNFIHKLVAINAINCNNTNNNIRRNNPKSDVQFWKDFHTTSHTFFIELDSIYLFVIFLVDILCLDCTVLIDLLSSPETSILEYLLRITKLLNVAEGSTGNKNLLMIACNRYEDEKKELTNLDLNNNNNNNNNNNVIISNINKNYSYDTSNSFVNQNTSTNNNHNIITNTTTYDTILVEGREFTSHTLSGNNTNSRYISDNNTIPDSLHTDKSTIILNYSKNDCDNKCDTDIDRSSHSSNNTNNNCDSNSNSNSNSNYSNDNNSILSVLGKRHMDVNQNENQPLLSQPSSPTYLEQQQLPNYSIKNKYSYHHHPVTTATIWTSKEIEVTEEILSNIQCKEDIRSLLNDNNHLFPLVIVDPNENNLFNTVNSSETGSNVYNTDTSNDGNKNNDNSDTESSSSISIDCSEDYDDNDNLSLVAEALYVGDTKGYQKQSKLDYKDNNSDNENSVIIQKDSFDCDTFTSIVYEMVLGMLAELSEMLASLSKRNIFPFNAELLCKRLDRIVRQ